jgi:hypothetical protein
LDSSVKTVWDAKNARWLAWCLFLLYIVLMVVGLSLLVITGSTVLGVPFPLAFVEAIVLSVWSVIGALIVSRQPRHPVGWIWCFGPILAALDNLAWGYAYYGSITRPGSLPGVEIMMVWVYALPGRGILGPLLFTLLFLLFPTGRPLSRRWNMLAWIAIGTTVALICSIPLAPNPNLTSYFPFPRELFSVSGAAREVLEPLRTIALVLRPLCILAAGFSLFVRLVRATGVERQQLKWFVYTTLFIALGFFMSALGQIQKTPGLNSFFFFGISLVVLGAAGVALASAIAIFRYRLWDIDLIIRRTLVYSILIGILTLVYFSSIVFLQVVSQLIIGQNQPPVVTVVSTLTIAALFAPIRRRIQTFIDSRFYRRKYDAEKTLANFAAVTRNQIDLNELSAVLLVIVEEAMQPEHLSLWLTEQTSSHKKEGQSNLAGGRRGDIGRTGGGRAGQPDRPERGGPAQPSPPPGLTQIDSAQGFPGAHVGNRAQNGRTGCDHSQSELGWIT